MSAFRLLKSKAEELLNSYRIFGLVDDILSLDGVCQQGREETYKYYIMYAHKV